VVLQLRSATGGASSEAARRAGSAPEWVQLRRAGDTFTLAASNDGITWTTVGSTTVAMQQVIYVGLPVTSRVAGTLATAVFDDVVIEP
jgi:regulation of enolase protein 1 (concanavalin A-like superfamily)